MYKTFKPFICTILFGIPELFRKTLFKDPVGKDNRDQIRGKLLFLHFSEILTLIISMIKFINTFFLYDFDRTNKILQNNGSHALYSVIAI